MAASAAEILQFLTMLAHCCSLISLHDGESVSEMLVPRAKASSENSLPDLGTPFVGVAPAECLPASDVNIRSPYGVRQRGGYQKQGWH